MARPPVITLLALICLCAYASAQRTGVSFGRSVGLPAHSGNPGQGISSRRGIPGVPSNRFRAGFHSRRDGFGGVIYPYYLPDYEWLAYEQGDNAPMAYERPPIDERPQDWSPIPEKPPSEAQVIEIPANQEGPTESKRIPPTVFILTGGERLETQRYLLTESSLLVTVSRRSRSIPVEMLDFDATLAANRERGIELKIPADRNEISLSF